MLNSDTEPAAEPPARVCHDDLVRYELDGVELWDGTAARGASRIVWEDGRGEGIRSLEPADAPDPRFDGLSVIPGLIDTHVHLIGYAGAPGGAEFFTWPLTTRPEEQVLHGLANARAALAAGVTTLRDLSADDVQFSLGRALAGGIVDGPRLLAHGMVGMTGGHADLFTPAAFPIRKPTADGPDACRRLVREYARAGADGIKVATSGGVLSQGDRAAWRNHTDAELDAIVDEAHALGLPVAAHAHSEDGIRRALDAGVDSIEHATLITAELAERAAAAGVTVAPTLLINDRIASGDPRYGSAESAEKARALVVRRDALLTDAAARGLDFVLGTDANGHHVRFGDEPDELRAMARVLGWSAERTLQAATSRAAAAVKRGDTLGKLEAGASADLVVVRGRPWLDLDALRPENVVAVVVRGRVLVGALPGGSVIR
ncbi:amidohydrolase family protein [Gryllotalpicola reticulitermitis]|uniref:Amidohydrolase family protein n=1 Tax=Gryllotalpicola reticulitermitis TaxID=1184153 RepID=A0ABV8Q8H4_9MICO